MAQAVEQAWDGPLSGHHLSGLAALQGLPTLEFPALIPCRKELPTLSEQAGCKAGFVSVAEPLPAQLGEERGVRFVASRRRR